MLAAAGATKVAGEALKFAEKNPKLVQEAANIAVNVAAHSGGGNSVGALNQVVGAVVRGK